MKIVLSDRTTIFISDDVIAQDILWREHFREWCGAKWAKSGSKNNPEFAAFPQEIEK